ncbi:matrix-remodeling-associated protein 7 isoform X1 [Mustela erminea]|uniref:matrix-remodeling-associated protein 7 isoform X1 n=1 Tax=Mustela erminea TaxID=36723 RepID=UPI0013867396|nr:matrix-remodeling-associated protein 7 isoform X1 [Mustela erminea]
MEAPAELLAALPVLATVLALLLAWLLVRRGAAASPEPVTPAKAPGTPAPPCAPEPAAAPEGPGELQGPGEREAAPAEAEEQAAEAKQEEEEPEQEEDGEDSPPQAGPEEEEGGEVFSFKYSPGKLRGNQYKKMMTKEELEEEQRVQKEQLAAIFKLMQDNKETFGEMSAGDVQEQLRLYDM